MLSPSSLKNLLFRPINASILAYFRICFGILILIETSIIENYFINNLSHQKFHFKYDYLEWLVLLPSDELKIVFVILKVSTVLFTLGVFYRFSAIVQFTIWTYLFFSERGHYNNHFYFYCIILFFFCVIDANKYFAIRFRKSEIKTVPYWQLFIIQFQVVIVYFFGAIAKLNSDWLSGFPMLYWLPGRVENFPSLLSSFLSSHTGALFISYSGLIFDLIIGFMLFSNRWRYLALVLIIAFNVINHFIWNIGTFPWAMLVATFLFYNPNWPTELIKKIKTKQIKLPNIKLLIVQLYKPNSRVLFEGKANAKVKPLTLMIIVVYFTFQLLFPLRHLMYKGDVAWTGEGHLFSWRMMLTSSDDAVRIGMKFPNDPNQYYVDLFSYMNRGQLNKITKTPKMVIKFIEHLKDEVQKNTGITSVSIHLEMYKSVNYRKPQLLNDTTINYANVNYDALLHADWILPNTLKSSDLRTDVKDDSQWEGILF